MARISEKQDTSNDLLHTVHMRAAILTIGLTIISHSPYILPQPHLFSI